MNILTRYKRQTLLVTATLILILTALTLTSCGEASYIAAVGPTAKAYTDIDQDKADTIEIIRGTQVKVLESSDDSNLVTIQTDDGTCYVDKANVTDDYQSIVLEEHVYVRTPVTLYKTYRGPEIAGFAPKGSKLTVVKHSKVLSDGSVRKYKVKYDGLEGYVYSKYLVYDKKSAKKNCNRKGAYDMAKSATYPMQLYGGKATNLDYYPCQKPSFKDNEFCDNARAMYLHAGAAVDDKYLKLAKKNGVNAVVINIDGGTLAYKSPVAEKLCPSAYKDARYSVEKYQQAVEKYNDAGIYTIGRIVAFNDPHYAKDHKKACIISGGKSTKWVSAYNRGAWEYKVSLALESVELMGFNEIQYDYVRFPEASYQMSASGKTNFRNKYNEEKAQAIQNFCFYAADMIHDAGAYMSVDVFGECSNGYVTAYGQYWPALSNVVDAISSMPYTDHNGETDTWTQPYATLNSWAKNAASMQKKIPTPACARTWITGYNTPHWNPTVNYGYDKLREQVDALEDAGLDGGFIPWHSGCDYGKYKQYKKIWHEK